LSGVTRRRYPLEALETLRRQTVDERALDLAEQRQRAERAAWEANAARLQRTRAEGELETSADAERQRVSEGVARAADLAQADAFYAQERARIAELSLAEAAAAAERDEQRRAEAHSQQALAEAEADAQSIEKHRAGWQAARDRKAELSEEEEVQDAWLGRAHRGGKA
jgi:hypothetical protein